MKHTAKTTLLWLSTGTIPRVPNAKSRCDAVNFSFASVYPVLLHRALQEVLNRIFTSGYFAVIVGLED